MLLSDLLARDPSRTCPQGSVDARLRVAAVAGLGTAVALAAWLWISWSTFDSAAPAPDYFFVGWSLVVASYRLGGLGLVVLRALLIMLALGAILAVVTRGFAEGTPLTRLGMAAVAGVGMTCGIPLAFVLAVCALNLALWVLWALVLLVISAALVRAYFRRLIGLHEGPHGHHRYRHWR